MRTRKMAVGRRCINGSAGVSLTWTNFLRQSARCVSSHSTNESQLVPPAVALLPVLSAPHALPAPRDNNAWSTAIAQFWMQIAERKRAAGKRQGTVGNNRDDERELRDMVEATQRAVVADDTTIGRQLLSDPTVASALWKTIMMLRLPRSTFHPLFKVQLQCVTTQQRQSIESCSEQQPYLAAYYVLRNISLPRRQAMFSAQGDSNAADASQAVASPGNTPEASISHCTTLVQVAQLLRRWERAGHVAADAPLKLSSPALRSLWRIAHQDADRGLPSGKSAEVLSWIASRVTLDHKKLVPRDVRRQHVRDEALAFGALDDWTRALSAVTASRDVPVHHKTMFRRFVVGRSMWQDAIDAGSASGGRNQRLTSEELLVCIECSPAWYLALLAATQWCHEAGTRHRPQNDDEAIASALSLKFGDALSQRPDTPWVVGIQWYQLHCAPRQLRVVRVLELLQRKTQYPHPPEAAAPLIRSANEQSHGTLLTDGSVPLRVSIPLLSQGRWDLALAVLCAAGHVDVAAPIAAFLKEESKDEQHHTTVLCTLPPNLVAFSAWTGEAPVLALGTDGDILDAQLLAYLLQRRTRRAAAAVDSAALEKACPRTQSLYAAVLLPNNPFSPLFHGCFVFQSRGITRLLLDTAFAAARKAFVAALPGAVTESNGSRASVPRTEMLWRCLLHEHCGFVEESLSYDAGTIGVAVGHSDGGGHQKSLHQQRVIGPIALHNTATIRLLTEAEVKHVVRKIMLDPGVCIASVEDWRGFLCLAARHAELQFRKRRRRVGVLRLEATLLRYVVRLAAADKLRVPHVPMTLGLLCALSGCDHATSKTVLAASRSIATEDLLKCPVSTSVAAKAMSLNGQWEQAVALFRDWRQPTPSDPEDGELALLCWKRNWLDVVMCSPTPEGRRLAMRLYGAVGDQHRPATSVLHYIDDVPTFGTMARLWRGDNTLAKKILATARPACEAADDAQGPETATSTAAAALTPSPVGKLAPPQIAVLSAALCLLRTKEQLLPIARALSRPVRHDEVRAVALRKVMAALPWHASLSILTEVAVSYSIVDESPLLDTIGCDAMPAAALHDVAVFAAERGLVTAMVLSTALAILHELQRDDGLSVDAVVSAIRRLRYVVDSGSGWRLTAPVLRQLALVVLRDGGPSLAAKAGLVVPLVALCQRTCEQDYPLLLKKWRHAIPDQDTEQDGADERQPFDDGGGASGPSDGRVARALLMVVFLYCHVAHLQQAPVHASVVSCAARVASRVHDWTAALHFFSLLRHPTDNECATLAVAFRHAPWRRTLQVLSMHARLRTVRPDVQVLTLETDVLHQLQDGVPLALRNRLWERSAALLAAPMSPRASLKMLAGVIRQAEADAQCRATGVVATLNALTGRASAWGLACRLLAAGVTDGTDCVAPDADDLDMCVVRPVVAAEAVAAAEKLLALPLLCNWLGEREKQRLLLLVEGARWWVASNGDDEVDDG